MKKLMVLAVMAVASLGAYAQHAVGSLTLQPRVALNLANVTKVDDSSMRVGLAAGAELEYQLTDMFSLAGGVMYSMQGCKQDFTGGDITTKIDYLNIPIVANVYLAPGFAIKAGIQPGFNTSSDLDTDIKGIEVKADDDVKSFDFSIPLGLSYEYQNIVLDARYNLGLTKISDGSDSKNSVFQITLGYKFDL